jgi:hypothetical protein
MTKNLAIFAGLLAIMCLASITPVSAGGIGNPPGFPLYVIIEVNWDGVSPMGDWTVWGQKWAPEVGNGTILSSCTICLDMNMSSYSEARQSISMRCLCLVLMLPLRCVMLFYKTRMGMEPI